MSEQLFDQEAFQALMERVKDAVEALGLTVVQQGGGIDDNGDLIMMTATLVRKTAVRKVTEDVEARKTVNQMAADDAQSRLDKKVEAYRDALESGDILDVLTGKRTLSNCAHLHDNGTSAVHEGLCLLCQEEVTSET